jgi:hypothetical protein
MGHTLFRELHNLLRIASLYGFVDGNMSLGDNFVHPFPVRNLAHIKMERHDPKSRMNI